MAAQILGGHIGLSRAGEAAGADVRHKGRHRSGQQGRAVKVLADEFGRRAGAETHGVVEDKDLTIGGRPRTDADGRDRALEGDRRPDGPIYGRIGMLETVEAALNHPHYKSKLEGKNRGRGVASGYWFNGGGESSATLQINADGTILIATGSPDIGGSRASMAITSAASAERP